MSIMYMYIPIPFIRQTSSSVKGADVASLPHKFPFVYFWLHPLLKGAGRGCSVWHVELRLRRFMVACNKRNHAARALPEVHFNGIGTRPRKGAYFDIIFGVTLESFPPPLWLPHLQCGTSPPIPVPQIMNSLVSYLIYPWV